MKKLVQFLRECGAFFVLTIDGASPSGRPFGAVMEHDGSLYISTADMKAVYRQLKAHPQMQIVALKPGTRQWLRISGTATECADASVKQKMLNECPVLTKHFPTPNSPHYAVFQISVSSHSLHP